MNITRINTFQAAETKASELFSFLQSLLPYISSCHGCISCEVLADVEDSGEFVVLEVWDSIESHKKSVQNFPKDEMQKAMALFAGAPKGRYYRA